MYDNKRIFVIIKNYYTWWNFGPHILLKCSGQNTVYEATIIFFNLVNIKAATERIWIVVCELWNTILFLLKCCLQLRKELVFVLCNAEDKARMRRCSADYCICASRTPTWMRDAGFLYFPAKQLRSGTDIHYFPPLGIFLFSNTKQ
jgi:hypothetical protein